MAELSSSAVFLDRRTRGEHLEGGGKLRLAQPTISAQIRQLEESLGERLFQRQGRTLVPTDVGRIVYRYADEIFSIGRELQETLRGRPAGRPLQLTVGVANSVPNSSSIGYSAPPCRVRRRSI